MLTDCKAGFCLTLPNKFLYAKLCLKLRMKGVIMKKLLLLFGLYLFLSGLGQAQATGILYEDTIYPIIATDMKTENVKDLKCGEVQVFNSMGLFETGHAGIQKAAIRAGITQIHHVDVKTKRILFWRTTTIQVYGE